MIGGIVAAAFAGLRLAPFPGPWFFMRQRPSCRFCWTEIFQTGKQRHMTAEDVFRVLLDERSDIGLATVYRVLTQFEQAGILLRSNFESGKAVYELNEGQHHDHLVCTSCGKVEEFFDPEIEKRQMQVADRLGWTIQDHAMSLYGVCAHCLGKK